MLNATHGNNQYTEKVTGYDKNGNILGLQRYGQTGSSTYGLVDNLTYTYNGNKLTRVDDAVTATSYTGGTNFINGASTNNEYTYDQNGNLTKDSNKGIANITYNLLSLPQVVTFSDGSTITYTYTHDGKKLRTVHVIGGVTTTTDYCGNVIYENGTAKKLLTDGGYVDLTTTTPTYYYYLTDHQGNNRAVISAAGSSVLETNHYYPFGGLFSTSTNVQPYKYNGKELDTKGGLNLYDYGARHYDAALGRWHVVDPMAEERSMNSPYSYVSNNPINKIDPTGMLDDWVENKDGQIYWDQNATSQETTKDGETYLGKVFVLFEGSESERLGTKNPSDKGFDGKHTTGYIDGEGAVTATVTVYGPKGENDIKQYNGFSMTSDYSKYGAIADGDYNVTYRVPGKSGALSSNYAVNDTNPVDCLNGVNPSPPSANPYSSTQKNGIYVHSTNKSGWAGGMVSTGCLLINANHWNYFKAQIGNNDFKLRLIRK